jgi:hypothetical protein
MWTDTPESQQLVGEISKDIVAEIAPEELEFADELLEEHRQNPRHSAKEDDPLGFGADLLVALTPVVAMAVQAVVKYLAEEVLRAAKEESSALIVQKIKVFFGTAEEKKKAGVSLSQEELAKVRTLVKKEAVRGGMPAQDAESLALQIVGRLALGTA